MKTTHSPPTEDLGEIASRVAESSRKLEIEKFKLGSQDD